MQHCILFVEQESTHIFGEQHSREGFLWEEARSWELQDLWCLRYSHVPSDKRTKIEPTTKKGIFVGYNETSKDFCIYIPSLRKTIVRRDVRFEEDRACYNTICRLGKYRPNHKSSAKT
jgi:hypothetical protein